MGSQHLADAVTHQQIRPHPPATPQLAEGVTQRKQGWLGGPGLVQSACRLGLITTAGRQQIAQRLVQLGIQKGRHPLKGLPEAGVLEQLLAHPQGLGPLTGEQPGQLAGPPRGRGAGQTLR